MEKSIYTPRVLRISEVAEEAPGVCSLRAEPIDGEPMPSFAPGQFALWSAFGEGECPLALTSPPGETGFASCTFRRVGRVTAGLSRLDVGDAVGFRGPFGKGFPLGELDGRNLLFVAGGIGLAALRSLIEHVLERRDRFGTLTLLVGARTPDDLLYKTEFEGWQHAGLSLLLTVDPPPAATRKDSPSGLSGSDRAEALSLQPPVNSLLSPLSHSQRPPTGGALAAPGWQGRVGLVPQVLAELTPSAANTVALVCGPPLMVRFTLVELERLDFPRRRVYTTLEARMKCGVGKCGHCSIGSFAVCRDGPVVSGEVLAGLADEW